MEQFVEKLMDINEPKTLFILCGIFIFSDVMTGYLKAIKNRKINSSISRDGYIKKISWIIALILGFTIDYFVKVNLFLIGSAIVCIATEGISVYENLGEIGIHLPFKKYFEKVNGGAKC
ncbi:MAG: phage holin family protein [Tenericutes bacterium]|mgnify:FL=1|nr:phage holin family protein [Mycoplasmatota bacterium]